MKHKDFNENESATPEQTANQEVNVENSNETQTETVSESTEISEVTQLKAQVDLLEVGVAHDQPVMLVPENEGFRGRLDRVRQPLIGLRVTLGELGLLGHVHGDADQVDAAGIGADDLRTGAQPDIMAGGMADAEDLVDVLEFALGDAPCQ